MPAYYNEIDPYAAQWLRNLISAGHIAPGDVDERSIVDVRPDELAGYSQCHFFAGIGGWSIALRLAGWSDDRPVWTGSCPCQPFSAAGAGKAGDDERHLWPAWFPLIAERRPAVVFGEQVEAAIGWGWLDVVLADLEGEGYACGAAILPACGVGAPHIRQRCWFVANAMRAAGKRGAGSLLGAEAPERGPRFLDGRRTDRLADGCETGGVADANGGDASTEGLQRGGEHGQRKENSKPLLLGNAHGERRTVGVRNAGNDGASSGSVGREAAIKAGSFGGLEHASSIGRQRRETSGGGHVDDGQASKRQQDQHGTGIASSHWCCDWLPCTDGKARPVEPGTFPLAHGIPKRVGRLRAYGNAIVPQVAAEFIAAASEAMT